MNIRKTKSYAATMGTVMLLLATTSHGALAQSSTGAFTSTQTEADVVLINERGQDEVFAALQAQGFIVTEVGRTFLGRIQITAVSEVGTREIVIHQRTGEILRDVMISGSAQGQANATVGADGQGAVSSDSGAAANTGSSASSGSSSIVSGSGRSSGNTSVSVGGGNVSVGGSGSVSGGISLGN